MTFSLKTHSSWPQDSVSRLTFPIIAGIRIALSLANVTKSLRSNPLLSSPLDSFLNLQEGVYLFKHAEDPYSGGSFHHSPLFLSIFTTLLPSSQYSPLIWAFCDIAGALALVSIWRARQNTSTSSWGDLITIAYILNPYVILPSLAMSTSSLENMLILITLKFASQGRQPPTLLFLAFLVQVSLSYLLLILPIFVLVNMGPSSQLAKPHGSTVPIRPIASMFGKFLVYSLCLTFASTIIANGWSWTSQTWGASLLLPDLTPNPGLWWYFFTEMFDHFRPFFLMVFSVHLLIYVFPVFLKFRYDPLYASFILIGILGIFKPYPTLASPGLFISMIVIFPEIYAYLRHPVVTVLLYLHASLLMPLFHGLWLQQGTGNANFFYASTLVFACANGAALIDCIWAGLRLAIGPDSEEYVIIQE
ncbi:hypothetical protein AMATHDRAFT_146847 [Amanita thiersii Skay4041]|uniref:PIG-U-domain-containing protein n=1 Tax=Amanita thiersii Skay4041 TaxID=703135 RepID=A0A2A9NPS0_9AGAR|nr:hypothetical protein AMATHDRAFT_146847 [Amanita thiersii Skay4041]